MNHFVLTIQDDGNELIAAESLALYNALPDSDGFTVCDHVANVPRSAYSKLGGEILCRAATSDQLVHEIDHLTLAAENFRVEVIKAQGGVSINSQKLIVDIADVIDGVPKLRHPSETYVVISRKSEWVFGRLSALPDHSWAKHAAKPYRTSSSLPARFARSIVNLVTRPGLHLINPCCGTGSIALEACHIGAHVSGADCNWKMVQMSRKNTAHFGYSADYAHSDIQNWAIKGDVLVTDLPYDRNCKTTESNVRGIIEASVGIAPRAVFVAEVDLRPWILDAGYQSAQRYRVPKSDNFTRHVFVATVSPNGSGSLTCSE